jgi:hypothetical protein
MRLYIAFDFFWEEVHGAKVMVNEEWRMANDEWRMASAE